MIIHCLQHPLLMQMNQLSAHNTWHDSIADELIMFAILTFSNHEWTTSTKWYNHLIAYLKPGRPEANKAV